MSEQAEARQEPGNREIRVQLKLESGHSIELKLREDAPELAALFRILASRGSDSLEPAEQFLQLPLQEGGAACAFNSRQLVALVTEPPVLARFEEPVGRREADHSPAGRAEQQDVLMVSTPRHLVIDDFLAPDEHRGMLSFALERESEFVAGTVAGQASPHRQNRVIMNFGESAHSRLLCNRLLTWLPLITAELGMPLFPLSYVESQLTASNDGHYYRLHSDTGQEHPEERVLTCVYYFFQEPRPFSGGALRLFDTIQRGNQLGPGENYQDIEPVSNRLVIFSSRTHHELMRIRCPSRQFGDSRFAVTNWIHLSAEPRPDRVFGWGHLHCGVVPPQFAMTGAPGA